MGMGSHAFFVLKMTKYVYYIPILNVTEINIYFFNFVNILMRSTH